MIQPGSAHLRWILLHAILPVAVSTAVVCPHLLATDQKPAPTIEGYVTAAMPPASFDVNGTHVVIRPETAYKRAASNVQEAAVTGPVGIMVGAYVEVYGSNSSQTITADTVVIREVAEKEVKGFGPILKVSETGPAPFFNADAYRIRVSDKTMLSFTGGLHSVAEVGPGVWIKYSGVPDKDGIINAVEAKFEAGSKNSINNFQEHPNRPKPDAIPAGATLVASDGAFSGAHDKVRMSDAGGWCGWHKIVDDLELQARVWRVGMTVVPDYQKQMQAKSRSKVHFRFFAIEDDKARSELFCDGGVVLVPRTVAERLSTDGELAAVLADGVAWFLEWQSTEAMHHLEEKMGADEAGGFFAGLAGEMATGAITEKALLLSLRKQRDRIELTLLADAGYDPWVAPEVWRLLAVKDLPADLTSLKYPSRSGYQLAILNLAYKKPAPTVPSATAASR